MKIKNIGLARYLYYEKYKELIKNYFEYLGYNVILSNKELCNKKDFPNRCTLVRNYLNHIIFLEEKCDIVIVPHQSTMNKIETICPNIENMHTIAMQKNKNVFTFNLNYPITIILTTLRINKNIPKIIVSYILARIDYNKNLKKKTKQQHEEFHNIAKHLLLVNNPYYEYEVPLSIKKEYHIINSNYLNEKIVLDYFKNYHGKTHIKFIKIMIGSIYYAYQAVDKIYVINIVNCKYSIKKYLKCLEPEIQNKITIINI